MRPIFDAAADGLELGITPSWPQRAGRPLAPPNGSAEFLGQRDDDAFGATEVAEQKDVLVLHHLAD
jgi:hypothetical protein